jgi:DHA3 family tetracycline resistance protein-like MFS transporter
LLSPLRNRDFAVLWVAMTVSLIGDGVYFVAVAWQAFRLSNTPGALALVGVAWTLPSVLFLVVGGALSDRLERRSMMVGAAIAQALAIGAIGVLASAGALSIGWLLALVAAYGGAQAFFAPAFEAIVPTLVPEHELLGASALDQFVHPLAIQMVGPAIGGIVIAVSGTGPAFLLDAASFVVAAGALLSMRCRRSREPGRAHMAAGGSVRSALTEVAEGLRFVRANPWLWRTLVAAALSLLAFVGPSQVLLPYLVKNELHAGSGTLGAIRAAGGVGALLAALTIGRARHAGPLFNAMFAAWALQCIALAGYALVAGAWVFAAISMVSGALGAVGNVIWGTLMKTHVPNRLLGRVSSLDWLVSIGLVPLSFAITGPIAAAAGANATLIGAGLIAGATMLVFIALPGTRSPEAPSRVDVYERGPVTASIGRS